MKLEQNQRYFTVALYALCTIVLSGILLAIFTNFDTALGAIRTFVGVLSPVWRGAILAYLLNPIMLLYENKMLRKLKLKSVTPKQKSRLRGLTVFLTAATTLLLIGLLMRFVVPQVLAGVTAIAVRLNADGINLYFDNIVKFFADRFGETSTFAMTTKDFLDSARGSVLDFWNNMASKIDLSILTSDTGKKILGGVFGAVSSVLDFVVAFVIAINMLLSKEILQMQFKKIFYAFLKKDIVVRAFEILSKTNLIFRKYMVAILLDACIVGSITFIGCTILGVKYALLVGVMVGVTNIIPFFGPFIGGIPSALLILAQSPLLALYFVIFMLIVQQVDGNIFVPLIQGDATGLPAVWVLASVVIGGGVFGFWGLVCAVPVSAVLYMLFKETAENRLRKRNLPVDSVDYAEGAPHIDEEF